MTKTLPFDVLDGANTIGGTKIMLKEGGHGLLLDFGVNYNRFGKFFEEYLKPRSSLGLTDLWLLGVVPPFQDLYRDDLKLGALPASRDLPVNKIDAIVISHGHMDHVGLVSLLNPNIPIVSSATTLAILRAIQDSGKTEDIKYLNDIIPNEGLYIYSSSEPYTEEQMIDFIRLYNWLSQYNFEIRGFRMEDEKPVLEQGYHCSGHITVQELEEMIREINPEILVPVHTQDPQWFQRKFSDSFEVILPIHSP